MEHPVFVICVAIVVILLLVGVIIFMKRNPDESIITALKNFFSKKNESTVNQPEQQSATSGDTGNTGGLRDTEIKLTNDNETGTKNNENVGDIPENSGGQKKNKCWFTQHRN